MNLTDSYLSENGYDYFGNAAEDTLVFFVRDEEAPYVEPFAANNNESIINLSDNIVNGLSADRSASNDETQEEKDHEKRGDDKRNFDLDQDSVSGENEYEKKSVSGSMPVSDANTDDEFSGMMPHMAQKDMKQTETGPSNREAGMNN